jgi:hypothetical protein
MKIIKFVGLVIGSPPYSVARQRHQVQRPPWGIRLVAKPIVPADLETCREGEKRRRQLHRAPPKKGERSTRNPQLVQTSMRHAGFGTRLKTWKATDLQEMRIDARTAPLASAERLCVPSGLKRSERGGAVIIKARALALGEVERERAAAAVKRWLLAEFDRGHGLQPGQQIARSHGTRGGY